MKNAVTRRLEKLERNLVPEMDKITAILWVVYRSPATPGGPVESEPVNGWSFYDNTRAKVTIMRQPGEDDESLKNRAIEASEEARGEGTVAWLVSVFYEEIVPDEVST